ncbi:MAG: hypothetical protein ACRC1H_01915 [Caldilineaceae bacterium]
MKLIANWRSAWRMFTVQIATAAVAWGALPREMQTAVLEVLGAAPERVPALLGGLMLLARLIDQPSTRGQQ